MTNIVKEREKERSIRYRIQACPGTTRLFAEFDVTQSDLLERFIELLLHRRPNKITKTATRIQTSVVTSLTP